MKQLTLLLLVSLILFRTASASTEEAEKRLHTVVDAVVKIAEGSSSNSGLAEKLRPLLQKYLSFDAMTRRAVGPGWRQFSKAQQSDAIGLFTTLIIRTYATKYTPGEHPAITYKTATEPAPGRVEIPTTLVYKGSRYSVIYRMEAAEGWRITDVVAEGVSLVANYRSQFDAQFKKGGATAVLNSLTQAVDHPK
ncbi:MAG: MlaC/ttg2D family ABC transporter substrate-binding protein [Chthoniobacterales bacterium]